jgi:tetracycline resistance efflux pump
MVPSWFVLLPPLAVLIAALTTKRLNLSLIIGLICAGLVASNFAPWETLTLIAQRIFSQLTDPDNIYLYSFLILLGILISLLEYIGAATAFAHRLTTRLRSARSSQFASMSLSCALFIDDYLSCLTTGYVMRPIMDRFNVPRVKLAYLIHSLSGPLVILAPISSWIALITSQLESAGISPDPNGTSRIFADPFYVYLRSIPYIFYSIILIISVWFIVKRNISFGPMGQQEEIAHKTGNLFGGKNPLVTASIKLDTHGGSMWDLVIPLAILIITFIGGILWAGGYSLFGGTNSFLQALQKNNQTALALFIASIMTLLTAVIIGFARKRLSTNAIKPIIINGFSMMKSSVVMVFLASTLGVMLKIDLQTGTYLAQVLLSTISVSLLPVLFYIISIITALITGSAWGTIALLIPIAVQLIISLLDAQLLSTLFEISLPAMIANANKEILFPVLGAIFSGAVCGNHISPIAETMIMSSNSAGCYPIDHAITQFWYALPVIFSAGISYLLVGISMHYFGTANLFICLGIGIVICLTSLSIANRLFRASQKTQEPRSW